MRTVILMAVFGILDALHCDKEFNYYDDYGNGFDITCQGITKEYAHLLQNITITNEISLSIENSTLNNITSKLFHNVRNIRYLFVQNSTFSFSRRQSVFEMLKRLEHLVIRDTNIYINKLTFAGLNKLKELILSNNNLEEIEDGSFQNLPHLKYLQLTNNKITDMKHLPLCELKELRGLNLSNNAISSLKDVHFYCRESTKSVGLNLNNQDYRLNINDREYFSVTDISFKLFSIDLSYNNISKLEYSLADLKNLKVLNLEGNRLVQIEYKELSSLESLEKVFLKNNLIKSIDEKVFNNQKNLEYLDLSYNKLKYFSLNNTPMLQYINLAHNKLDMVSLNHVNNTSHLKTFILSNNTIGEIEPFIFRKHIALEILNLADNNIRLHEDSFGGLSQLKDLSIRNNNIDEIPPTLFKSLTNLRKLDLSENKIKYFQSNDTFKGLSNLEILNISYNLLQELNYALLQSLKNLNILDIAGNRLHYIQYDLIISDLPVLSVLNIKSNYLSCELLYKIIKYLKHKAIGYTINEQFDYEQENVAGIYCNSEKNLVPKSLKSESMSGGSYALFVIGGILGVILVLILIGVAIFKIHVFLKRRKYKADEFELIHE